MISIIAEIAQAHEGSLGIAHSYIDALAETGIDTVKFQTHIAEAESSLHEPFRVKFSYEDDTRYDYWKRMEFTPEQWEGLKKHCNECNVEFMSSPFSLSAVDLLEKIGVSRYKIGSGEVTNKLMLEKIVSTRKPIILSSGMSSLHELDDTINFITTKNQEYRRKLSLLQCTTAYPTYAEQWGLGMIEQLKKHYNVPVGFSDHSGDIFASLAAVALGAEIIEFHVVFDKKMFGPDAKSSLTITQVSELVKGIRKIERAITAKYDKNDLEQFSSLKSMFEKSLCVNKFIPAGNIITINDLETKKPTGYGISASQYEKVIGKVAVIDINKWGFITEQIIK